MGANFPRVKTWVSTEDVTYSDLNAEFDNIINNLTAANVDDYSANVSQMQSMTDPGEVGTESLATSVAGEIQRLRKLISEITGEDEWYESPVSSLLGLANSIGTGLTNNRIVSGAVRSTGTNSMPIFLKAAGTATTITVQGSTTNFIYYVNGTEYTISTNVNLTGLTVAPASNNTCLVNDTVAADQAWTKDAGEDGSEIPVDNMGTEITALTGKFAAFKIAGTTDEYFTAYVESSTRLTKARRGYFFDSTSAPVPRAAYSNNDVITLMKLTWIFAKTDGTLTATYNNPVWSKDEPSSPALGDYWYDLANNTWKVYGVGSYSSAGATLIGVCIQDGTNTIGSRSFEFFGGYDSLNTCELIYSSATQIKSRFQGSIVNVWGTNIKSEHNIRTWDITIDRDTGVSESASTYYYVYLTNYGDVVLSDVKPYDRREDLQGYYHPYASWRCLGYAYNDGSSNITDVSSYYTSQGTRIMTPTLTAAMNLEAIPKTIRTSGAGGAASYYLPAAALARDQEYIFVRTDNTVANAVTIDAFSTETIGSATTYVLALQYQSVRIVSDGSNWIILSEYVPTVAARVSGNAPSASSTNPIIYPTADFDTHTSYGTGTGLFTCPIAGYYLVSGNGQTPTSGAVLHVYKNSSSEKDLGVADAGNGDLIFSVVVSCAKGDTLSIRPVGGAIDSEAGSFISYARIR